MSFALVRPIRAIAWECRSAWAAGWRIALSLDERCEPRRVEGTIRAVSPTDASVTVAGLHVPLDAVLALRRPSRLGDSQWVDGERWNGRRYKAPQAEELPLAGAMATPSPTPADTPVNSTWLPGPRCTNCGEGPLRREGLCGWCEPVTERSAA